MPNYVLFSANFVETEIMQIGASQCESLREFQVKYFQYSFWQVEKLENVFVFSITWGHDVKMSVKYPH